MNQSTVHAFHRKGGVDPGEERNLNFTEPKVEEGKKKENLDQRRGEVETDIESCSTFSGERARDEREVFDTKRRKGRRPGLCPHERREIGM